MKKGGAGKATAEDTKSKKKKKKASEDHANPANGTKLDPAIQKLAEEEEEEEYDSIDEEEEYYQENVHEVAGGRSAAGDEDEEDEDDTLLLRDIVRPLEAWNFHLTGKEALETDDEESDDEDDETDEVVDGAKSNMPLAQTEESGNDDGAPLANGTDTNKSEGNKDDDGEHDAKKPSSTNGTPS
mmetsp:Transcript_14646/g.25383  ORF Transcript_14646/g.25383 Transcript_14646/m.25383 type:complete len:184 (-) Transcript_14646:171-722(-)